MQPQNITPEGLRLLGDIAQRNGVNLDAVLTLLDALSRTGGSQAQFSHPQLGGMGQWQANGMIMIGDMFNQNLKWRVDSLCKEIAQLMRNQPLYEPVPQVQQQNNSGGGVSLFVQGGSGSWWPSEFGSPSSSGAQNDLRYAYFPGPCRLVIQKGGNTRIFNTLNHNISGISQAQSGDQTLTFTSQFGLVRILDLPEIMQGNNQNQYPAPMPLQQQQPQQQQPQFQSVPYNTSNTSNQQLPTGGSLDDNMKLLERLAEMHQRGILTNEEYASKKAELLGRL